MCQIKSALILKNSVICPLDTDSHEDMITQAGLDDTTTNPKFVRAEMTPKDGNLFNHDPDNWQLKVDQDYKPDWFDVDDARSRMLPELKKWWAERFVLSAKINNITTGRWFVGAGGTVECVRAGGTVLEVLDGGTVQYVGAGGTVQEVQAGGTVQYVGAGGTAIFWGTPKTPPIITNTGIVIYRHEKKIIVADENFKLVQFRALKAKP